jgi:hypothetical protein
MRTVEYYDYDTNTWSGTDWSVLISGSMIRMYEEDGTPIPDGTGIYEMNVVSDAYQATVTSGGELIWHVDISDPDPSPVPRREK